MKDEDHSGTFCLEDAARAAIGGDRVALELLVSELQGTIYGLSLRMLCNQEDAEARPKKF